MTPYVLFAFGFLAGAFVGFRDLPLAAMVLGGTLLMSGLYHTGILP